MATPQGRRLGYRTPEQVSDPEPPDSRPCVLTTSLLGGGSCVRVYDLRAHALTQARTRHATRARAHAHTHTQSQGRLLAEVGPGAWRYVDSDGGGGGGGGDEPTGAGLMR